MAERDRFLALRQQVEGPHECTAEGEEQDRYQEKGESHVSSALNTEESKRFYEPDCSKPISALSLITLSIAKCITDLAAVTVTTDLAANSDITDLAVSITHTVLAADSDFNIRNAKRRIEEHQANNSGEI